MLTTSVQPQSDPSVTSAAAVCALEGWTLYEHESVTSTNLVAAALPLWTAVRAETQTAGRGRFQRSWVSDAGGLWLSAVVPLPAKSGTRPLFPLAVGVAVYDALQELGVRGARLRWPNDILVGNRKLAGLLIDQFTSDRAVVGIGINVRNHPETGDTSLKDHTSRLADVLAEPPSAQTLTKLLLGHLRQAVLELGTIGSEDLLARLNRLWEPQRPVELDLDGQVRRGRFVGVDSAGRLGLAEASGTTTFYEAHQVRQLTEI